MKAKRLFYLVLMITTATTACKPSSNAQILGMNANEYYSQFSYSKTGSDGAPHYHYMSAQGVPIQSLTGGHSVVANISIFILPRYRYVIGYDELTLCADGKTIVSVTKKLEKGQSTLYGTSIKFGSLAAALADADHPDTTVNVEFMQNLNANGLKKKTIAFTLADSTSSMADVLAQKYVVSSGTCGTVSGSASPSPTASR